MMSKLVCKISGGPLQSPGENNYCWMGPYQPLARVTYLGSCTTWEPFKGLYPATFQNDPTTVRTSRSHWPVAVCGSLKVGRVWTSLKLFFFFPPSVSIYPTECNTTNAFKERLSESVCCCNAHLYDSSRLRLQRHRVLGENGEAEGWHWQAFHSAMSLAVWNSYEQL